jgi:eukaryotic-like serine/threonine-protein kinase
VSVLANPEDEDVESLGQEQLVRASSGIAIGVFGLHAVHLSRGDRHPVEERFLRHSIVAVRMIGRDRSLVAEENVYVEPWHARGARKGLVHCARRIPPREPDGHATVSLCLVDERLGQPICCEGGKIRRGDDPKIESLGGLHKDGDGALRRIFPRVSPAESALLRSGASGAMVRLMSVESVEPNRILAGRYRLEARLGAGGMGAIWRAEHLVLKAPVAVKLIDREAVPDEDTMARFLREAQAAATLRSPHVVQIIDYGLDGKIPFMVMELLEGENLAQRLKRMRRLSRQETARILTQVGRAVQRAHEAGIVHRDLKPENVFMVRNEDDEIAKVLDFGVAKLERSNLGQEGTRTRTGSILGTPYYMSPEQAQGNKTVDYRSDLWALGVIAFECIVGKRPFFSDGLGDLVLTICVRDLPIPSDTAPVPLGFDKWFARACNREPSQRFQSARELTEGLRDALGIEGLALDTPEIVVKSEGGQKDSSVPSVGVPTVAGDSRALSSAQRRADPDALTMAAGAADTDVPAPTEALFGTTHAHLPEPKSNTSLVFMVAGAALAAGIVGGFLFLRKAAPRTELDSRTNFVPATVSAPAAAEPPPEMPDEEEAEPETATEEAIADAGTDADAGAGDAGPPRASSAARDEPPAVPEIPPTPTADGGWQKPDWAKPDNEIRVRRGPDEADEKIVIPKEE